MIEKMVKSAGWQAVLKERGWLDLYQPHDQFAQTLKEEGEATAAVLKDLGLAK
jgi:putative tricarboxylic transport membrane protein